VQQAFITVLNQALAQNIYPKINEILLRLLENPVSKGQEEGNEADPAQQAI